MILNNIGNVHYNQGKIEEALEYYHKTLNIYKKIGNESIDQANTLKNIGYVNFNQSKIKQALEYYSRALNIYEKIGKESN